ncbi:MAG: imidazolonepropionase [bacterium]
MAERREGAAWKEGDKADLIIRNARQLLTLAGPERPRWGAGMSNLGIIENGAVAAKDGRIVFVGKTDECLLESEREIDATGRVVMPGFVDAHTHLVFAGSREDEFALRLEGASYIEIAERGGGIKSTVASTRLASRDELIDTAEPRLDSMLRWGTTTAEAKSGYGLNTETEIKILEAVKELDAKHMVDLVPTYLGAHDFPPEFADNRDSYVSQVIEAIPEFSRRELAVFCDVFCEEGFFSVEQSRRILKAASRHGLHLKVHADELESSGGAELAAKMRAVSADHLARSSDAGLRAMKRAGTIAVLLPGTSFFLRKAPAPGRKMVQMGLPVAIASDYNPGSSPIGHMPIVIGLACLLFGFSPAEAITASTVNGAWAVGLGKEVGTLEPGKKADVLILRSESYLEVPYWFGENPVGMVVKNGKLAM